MEIKNTFNRYFSENYEKLWKKLRKQKENLKRTAFELMYLSNWN